MSDHMSMEVDKQVFVEALRTLPGRQVGTNLALQGLCLRYRDTLGTCPDIIPLNLEKFGFNEWMSLNRFIDEVLSAFSSL